MPELLHAELVFDPKDCQSRSNRVGLMAHAFREISQVIGTEETEFVEALQVCATVLLTNCGDDRDEALKLFKDFGAGCMSKFDDRHAFNEFRKAEEATPFNAKDVRAQ